MKESKTIWFRRKTYGWGWYPCCWKGWGAIFGFFIAMVLSAIVISSYTPEEEGFVMIFLPVVLILVLILLIVCLMRGEEPRWCWGKSDSKNMCNKK